MPTLEIVNVGTVANDRTGDTWRDAFVKVNGNSVILQAVIDASAFVSVAQESDFPTQTATTITLESQTVYVITAAFTTAKNFIVEDGVAWTSFNVFGPLVTYSGSGSMFSGTDAAFTLSDARINCPSAEAFTFTDTVVNVKAFKFENAQIVSCNKVGTFTGMINAEFLNSAALSTNDGVTYAGTSLVAATIDRMFFVSTSASFIGVDLGVATIQNIEFNNMIMQAPASAIGISGAASSANVVADFLAMVSNCSFSGGMTDLSGISTDDFRWRFTNNSPTSDTIEDALLSFNGNTTETVISASNTPVIVNATWVIVRQSIFTCTTGGRATSDSERDLSGAPIDVAVGIISAGGGAIDVTVYLAKNGSVITASATSISISGSNQAFVSIPWQDSISEDDFYEVFVENNTNTTNIIVESAKLRLR